MGVKGYYDLDPPPIKILGEEGHDPSKSPKYED